MALEQMVLTTPTFINGSLQPAGAVVTVDTDQFKPAGEEQADTSNKTPNLAPIGEAPVLIPTAVAAIGPTGPNPTMPQQVPPGSMQMSDGYANGPALLVAEGSALAAEAAAGEGAAALNEGVEEEAVERLSATTQDVGTAGTNGTETGALDEGQPFTADTYVTDVTIDNADFSGLTAEQLDAVQAAETSGANRAGMLSKIEAARSAL